MATTIKHVTLKSLGKNKDMEKQQLLNIQGYLLTMTYII